MKKSNDTIGNRTRDLPAFSAVPQPTAPPRVPLFSMSWGYFPGVKPPVRRVDDSPPSSAEVKNEWSYISTPLYALPSWRGKGQLYFPHLLSSRLTEVVITLL